MDNKKMTPLEELRHSAAHMMATAILRLWPDAQFAYGPPIETGFYYDFELDHRITPEDFEKIEAEMKKESKANHKFERLEVTREQALEDAQKGRLSALSERSVPSKFKIDLVNKIPEGEMITYYQNGDFIDLCAGTHVMRTGNVKAFKLLSVASAYYMGDEKNPQLQRIYGTAFKNKTELEEWLAAQEEARKRDHRKIGKDMQLFAFDDDVGPGLPLWLPNGAVLIEELEKLAKETEFEAGYQRVRTPHLAKESMYKTSGHLPYYAESMFPPMNLNETGSESEQKSLLAAKISEQENVLASWIEEIFDTTTIDQIQNSRGKSGLIEEVLKGCDRGEGGEKLASAVKLYRSILHDLEATNEVDRYYLKAMNCPHHHKIFAAVPRSYRDLPLRLAEYGCCYRYEQSGELMGLMRVRSMQMNDAHIYCTPEQFASEFQAVNEMYLKYFKIFGFEKYQMRFSTHDPEQLGKKFVDNPELWKQTEDMVRQVLIDTGINYVEIPNEAAFYGPKIDVQVYSISGREFTIATNQVDFAVPARFGLTYRDSDNTDKTPLCIHRAPLGTHERFIAFLIEHYAGNFPLWLAPEQVRVLPITEEQIDYCKDLVSELRRHEVRAEMEFSHDKLQGRILRAEEAKVHTMLVVGGRDMESGNVSVRLHGQGNQGAKPKDEVVAEILKAIKERRA